MRKRHAFAGSTLVGLTLAACGVGEIGGPESHADSAKPVVYGQDHRRDVYDYGDQAWATQVASFTAALMGNGIDRSNPNDIGFDNATLGEAFGLCSNERFVNQITAAFCSSTLVAPDLVVTAGHCINSGSCSGTYFVFDYYMTSASSLHTVTSDDVYECAEIVAHGGNAHDYAVVRLDRPVVGRTPAMVDERAIPVANGTPLVVHGYGSGLPLKIDDGGKVRDANAGELDTFVANLDTFGGNSGSGVFRRDTGKMVGILVSGETDYVKDGACWRVNKCPDTGCSGENSTYVFHAVAAACAADPDSTLCGGDGPTCGDGVCSGGETAESCPADCDDGPTPGGGDTCADAVELTPAALVVESGDTRTASDDYAGTCVGGDAPDRVYEFTLTSAMTVDARTTGYDTGLYLRQGSCTSGTQLSCNDDATPPGNYGSRIQRRLNPGTYFLFVDGYGSEAGAYELRITFKP